MLALSKLRNIAVEAVQKACIACIEIQSNLVNEETINKKDKSPVTVGDYTVQALIIDSLLSHTEALGESEYSIIAEEEAETLATEPEVQNKVLDYFNRFANKTADANRLSQLLNKGSAKKPTTKRWWTIDPIDGTLGFLRRDQYAVALALMEDNVPVLGILGCPSLPISSANPSDKGCILIAQRGAGSFIRHINIDDEQPIHVSSKSDSTQAIFTESYVSRGFGHELNSKISLNLGVTKEPLRIDSQCKYAMVARGDSDIYLRLTELEYKECIWDHAAGAIIVEEAGGKVFDFKGNPLDYSVGRKLQNNVGIVCSNTNLYPALTSAIKKSIDL